MRTRAFVLGLSAAVLLASCTTVDSQRRGPGRDAGPPCTLQTIDGPSSPRLRLIAVGDAGDRTAQLEQTLAAMRTIDDVDGILLTGDNIYNCGARDTNDAGWSTVIAPLLALGEPVFPVLGNHDWGSRALHRCGFSNPRAEIAKSGQPGFENWIFPDSNYRVQTDVAEIILFDSTPIAERFRNEKERPLCALRTALAEPKVKPWRIVVAHHPPFSCGDHGGDRETVRVREAVEPLLTDVDLYVAGHDHNLEIRTEPASSPLYLISGAGARTRESDRCPEGPSFRVVGGFAVLDLTETELSVRVFCNGESSPCMERTLSRSAGSPAPAP